MAVWAAAIGGILLIAVALYIIDIAVSSGKIPRGVQIEGVEIGGMSRSEATRTLADLADTAEENPVTVVAEDQEFTFVPRQAGLTVDLDATVDRVGAQPLNPVTRLTSFFRPRHMSVVTDRDESAFDAALERLREEVDREPVEAEIVLDDGTATLTEPAVGRELDTSVTGAALTSAWFAGTPVEATVEVTPARSDAEQARRVLAETAEPAVASDVVVTGHDGARAVLAPEKMGEVLTFHLDDDARLVPEYDAEAAREILAPQLESTETKARDATVELAGGRPRVVEAVDGERIDWDAVLDDLPALLADDREREAEYVPDEAEFTTEQAEDMGITEVVAEFSTGGFESASGTNIRRVAEQVNGAVVRPGDTFSLNGYTGPRGTAQGYVESGIIKDGRADRAVGGGISQFATTLYNAAYFAGLDDVAHTEHSYYISRYPAGREATVYEGAIDLQFANPFDTGVLIQAVAGSSDVTVRIWGTKQVEVESVNGGRWNSTSPPTVNVSDSDCVASSGSPGFTTSDTRIIRSASSGSEISRETRTVVYDPAPNVVCR